MSKVRTLLLATASSVALAGGIQAVQAADMPLKAPPAVYKPVFSWTGCHVGAHWGWGWGKTTGSGQSFGKPHSLGTFDAKTSGPLFGGQLGCDYQWPSSNFVIGIEGSYSAADINGVAKVGGGGITNLSHGSHFKIDSIGSVTGRVGFTGWDPMVLLYLRGGWAWMHQRNFIIQESIPGALVTGSQSGWTIGGGVEWAWSFAPRWSTFVEYNHYEFNHKFFLLAPTAGETFGSNIKHRIDTVKLGVNYHFGGFGGP